jgi:hypothetical protein
LNVKAGGISDALLLDAMMIYATAAFILHFTLR